MSAAETGGPAFPCDTIVERDSRGGLCGPEVSSVGSTLRDYFAAKSLQGFLAGFQTKGFSITPDMQDQIAEGMYSMADAMIKARK